MKNISLFTLLTLLISCNNSAINNKIETIKAEPAGDQSLFFTEYVKDIELIPLDNKEEAFLSDNPSLIVYNSDYYIFNQRLSAGACRSENILLKFDSTGKFIGYIGDLGEEFGKYNNVKNFCISRDTIYVFSSPDFIINKFKLTGEFIEKETVPYKNYMQALKYENEYLLYLNLNNGIKEERLVVVDKKGNEISAFLPIKTKVSPYPENNCLSLKSGNEILIREFLNDTVYSYDNEGVVPRFVIDFAEKIVPTKEYLKSEGSMKDLLKKWEKPYSCISNFFENEKYIFMEIFDNLGYEFKYSYIYAIKNKNSGVIKWFDFEKENNFLRNSFHFFEGNKMYCLVSPTHFVTMTDNFKALIKNPELLDKITPKSNRILLIITFK